MELSKVLALGVVVLQLCWGKEFSSLNRLRSKTTPDVQKIAAMNLLKRIVGERASDFIVNVDPSIGPQNRDTYKLASVDGKLSITGTSGVAVAMGFYYFLKYHVGGQVTWAGRQTDLPTILPTVPAAGITMTTNDQFRYYQNVCTVSYSMAWWDWERWEREIDWMVLQGINLPLAFTGQEAIFQRVYKSMGFTDEDLAAHFGGPAFLAWARMGNIKGWGGPLPQAWMDKKLMIQHKILDRMRSLGIIPVLPGFAGHVPAAITRVFPHAKVTRLGPWARFNSKYSETYLLDFEDPLFQKIGGSFIKAMEEEFGVDHIYNADTFNEMRPASSHPSYLKKAASSVYKGMVAGDPDAIWLMQGWLFIDTRFWKAPQIEGLLSGVDKGKMIILDLFSDHRPIFRQTRSYYGHPFIWCMLHNFGGNMEMFGKVEIINTGPFAGRSFPNSTMVGTGLTPEGINQNEVVYELMNEMAWRKQPVNLIQWASQFQYQRYKSNITETNKAWNLLISTVYNDTGNLDYHGSTILKRPSTSLVEVVWYKPESLFQAWDNLVTASQNSQLSHSTLFRYDLVDVSRNSLQIMYYMYYQDLIVAYQKNDTSVLRSTGDKLVMLLDDVDMLLASDPHFLLGAWTKAAKNFSTSPNETVLYDFNSRNQVTLWGPTGQIRDYAAKQWSGLFSRYYKPRWQLFITMLIIGVETGTPFDAAKYDDVCQATVELPFSQDHTDFPSTPIGDSIQLATELHKKYRSQTRNQFFRKMFNDKHASYGMFDGVPHSYMRGL